MCTYTVILENHLDVNLFMQVSPQMQFTPTMLFLRGCGSIICHMKLKLCHTRYMVSYTAHW